VQWGYGQPHRRPAGADLVAAATRVENRLAGADANPYLAIAASLACGYLGMIEGLEPRRADHRLGLRVRRQQAAGRLGRALRLLRDCQPLADILGERFVHSLPAVKRAEHEPTCR
jgi:glutamine synthetase